MNKPLTFTAGQHYTTRDGREARVYATDGAPNCGSTIHGAIMRGGNWEPAEWGADGNYYVLTTNHPFDLISPWIEKPVVNWAAMPAWHDTVILSGVTGRWVSGVGLYHANQEGYVAGDTPCQVVIIPDSHAPTYTGDWRNSKVQRPA